MINKTEIKEILQNYFDKMVYNPMSREDNFDAGAMSIIKMLVDEYDLNIDIKTKMEKLLEIGKSRFLMFIDNINKGIKDIDKNSLEDVEFCKRKTIDYKNANAQFLKLLSEAYL